MLEIEGLRVSEAKIFRCAGSLRRCAPALARRLRRRAYPDLCVDPRHPGSPARTPSTVRKVCLIGPHVEYRIVRSREDHVLYTASAQLAILTIDSTRQSRSRAGQTALDIARQEGRRARAAGRCRLPQHALPDTVQPVAAPPRAAGAVGLPRAAQQVGGDGARDGLCCATGQL